MFRHHQLQVKSKQLQSEISQHRRIVDAYVAVSAGKATDSQHRLLGLWLLEQTQFDAAREHLRQSNDDALVAIGIELPASRVQMSALADQVESESKKTRYPTKTQTALAAYANHIRQLALARPVEPPGDPDMSETLPDLPDQSAVSPWERLPQGDWRSLTDILSMRELEASAKAAPRPAGKPSRAIRTKSFRPPNRLPPKKSNHHPILP